MKKIAFISLGMLVSILIFLNLASAQTDLQKKKNSIDKFTTKADKRFEKSKTNFIIERKDENGKIVTEIFSYSLDGNICVEKLKVNFQEGELFYEEEFYYQKCKLVFAYEKETAKADGEVIHEWTGVYFFDNGKLFDVQTNGHGKSEDDNWKPEQEVPSLSEKRLTQVKNHRKSL